ncbi:MAG: PP2C family protein-serine/threonine phosphatase [Candidatus Eisenbacteria bacterium]
MDDRTRQTAASGEREAMARSLEVRLREALGRRLAGAGGADDALTRLLVTVEGSGVGEDIVRLAEQLAERMDVERRVSREIAIAREVQGRLFPQHVPRLGHLELAARCIQARSVGGDYYDFLELGPQQIGLVIADVSGKGVHAALRMANLQAHLRSQAGSTPQDPLRALREVNRMMCGSSAPGEFATLFLAVCSDASRRLSYINCGHNPPLCVRRDGRVERFDATATVLGAFTQWECALGRSTLDPGDLLVMYSDGITEGTRGEEQFGEERMLEVLRARPDAAPDAIVSALLAAVLEFGGGEQSDDLTLVVARAR